MTPRDQKKDEQPKATSVGTMYRIEVAFNVCTHIASSLGVLCAQRCYSEDLGCDGSYMNTVPFYGLQTADPV